MMFKVNEEAIVKNTFARMEYSGDYTTYMVKKARDLSKFPQVCKLYFW